MQLRHGDMFQHPCNVLIFTGNATVRRDGCLVMGRGAALQAQRKYPGCNLAFGSLITHHARQWSFPYGVLIHPDRHSPILAVFQVKEHYSSLATVELIEHSCGKLWELAMRDWQEMDISLNFPGIGWGGLKRTDVLPLLKQLPDNVTVWEY